MSLNDFDLALARSAAEAARGAREINAARPMLPKRGHMIL